MGEGAAEKRAGGASCCLGMKGESSTRRKGVKWRGFGGVVPGCTGSLKSLTTSLVWTGGGGEA